MDKPLPDEISLEAFLEWENTQGERYEWIDGAVVQCAGGRDDHAAIISNTHAIIRSKVIGGPCFVRGSDRKLVPKDAEGRELGSFYCDLFVSCAPSDRIGSAAHYPTVIIEVLSEHVGHEFTKKKHAYLASRDVREYFIIDSTQRYVIRYAWTPERSMTIVEYHRGPVRIESIDLELMFEQIYAETDVRAILRPVYPEQTIYLD